MTVHALLVRHRRLWALLLATLMGVPLQRQISAAGPAMMARLGFDKPLGDALSLLLRQAQWMRTAAAAFVVFCIGLVLTRDVEGALWGTAFTAVAGLAGPMLPLVGFGLVYGLRRRRLLPVAWVGALAAAPAGPVVALARRGPAADRCGLPAGGADVGAA